MMDRKTISKIQLVLVGALLIGGVGAIVYFNRDWFSNRKTTNVQLGIDAETERDLAQKHAALVKEAATRIELGTTPGGKK